MNTLRDISAIKITLCSPERIKDLSHGEVKKPETINYRTLRPEWDGLFCERIFGTTKEWECACGKFKGIRYKGVICDRCGVEVTHFRVRRERIGHIELASPVAHIWYYYNIPSTIGVLLNISTNDLRSVLYFERLIITEMNEEVLKEIDAGLPPIVSLKIAQGDVLTEEQYIEILQSLIISVIKRKYTDEFAEILEELKAEKDANEALYTRHSDEADEIFDRLQTAIKGEMGAEPLMRLLSELNLDEVSKEMRIQMIEKSKKSDKRFLKKLETIEHFRNSGIKPEWMILSVVPVIPPELRPMVQLDGGRFATSDLNDLYRRVINRNNRLKRLISLRAPEVIIRNEKRMLQEAVDALFDNSKKKRQVRGAGNRPLKSLSDILKGKQGRFRQNLLGKRVDYSGRSVIVVGPELKMHQCGLPKKMALELFKPFIMHKLVDKGLAHNIKSAKKLIDSEDNEVWEILEDVVTEHPVFLNRAPTLHRLSIQAFEPMLIEGKAIRLHPLVCRAFNADFDGDQMAVHVPLSVEAQIEAWMLMLSSYNILNPANGKAIAVPTQDIVLGISYLTKEEKGIKGEGKIFRNYDEAMLAYESDEIELNSLIKVKMQANKLDKNEEDGTKIVETTLGRMIINDFLPDEIEFINHQMRDKELAKLINGIYYSFGPSTTAKLLDGFKEIGFKYATIYGATIGIDDIVIPPEKEMIIKEAQDHVAQVNKKYINGAITNNERYSQTIDIWTESTDKITDVMFEKLKEDRDGFNPIYMMADSGARGSKLQIRQLAGMRGLMAKPSGEIIELPIISNFKEGLTVLEYFISSHGARKGLADTALKTADAGYLTRRLVDVSQNIVTDMEDCNTINGITITALVSGDTIIKSLRDRIKGRISLDNVYFPGTEDLIVGAGKEINNEFAEEIEKAGIKSVRIRSVLTCESSKGVCVKCYGRNLATGKMVELGEAVGVIAAQSIGQPGTQLTMRTFHIGGTAHKSVENREIRYGYPIYIESIPKRTIQRSDGSKLLSRRGEVILRRIYNTWKKKEIKLDIKLGVRVKHNDVIGTDTKSEKIVAGFDGKIIQIKDEYLLLGASNRIKLRIGSEIFFNEDDIISKDETGDYPVIVTFDPYNEPIVTEHSGTVEFVDIVIGYTLKEERDETTGNVNRLIVKSKEKEIEYQPRVTINRDDGKGKMHYIAPYGSNLIVEENQHVEAGQTLLKIPQELSKTKDITGGLPRVAELFEARKPADMAVVTEIDGTVSFEGISRGKRVIVVSNENGMSKKYLIPMGKLLMVHEGDYVRAGDPLDVGPIDPHDILMIKGDKALQEYLLDEIQEVYRLQNVDIDDKHIAIIIRQMLRRVEVVDVGDTRFVTGQNVDKFKFAFENERVLKAGGRPATGKPTLVGITKASLDTESFISAASFQETTRVLSAAAIMGKVDRLEGLKENVIIGHLIPAGTGVRNYKDVLLYEETPGDIDQLTGLTEQAMKEAEESKELELEKEGSAI